MGCSILVVDDSQFIFKAIQSALEPHGFQIIGPALDGQQGVDMAAKVHPDVIIMDITMPVMDGMEATRRILSADPSARIIMLSSLGGEEQIRTSRQIGVKYFLTKPFDPDQMLKAIAGVLS